MKRIFNIILVNIVITTFLSCSDKLQFVLELSGDNEAELQEALDFYDGNNANTRMKREATKFIIINMVAQYSVSSERIDSFSAKVHAADTTIGTGQLKNMWKDLKGNGDNVERKLDIYTLNAEYIIDNTEKAYATWIKTPWHKEVSFEIFCNYILPYRFQNEQLAPIGWRDSLYKRYSPLIKDITDVRIAFARVYKALCDSMLIKSIGYPYLLNVLDMEKVRKGTCMQRSVYIAYVMRSLGIPAAIDIVDKWANYSTVGHSWVALITNNGTYTVSELDGIVRKDNPIDGSVIPLKTKIEDKYNYNTKFKKRCAKIWRMTFALNPTGYRDTIVNEVILDFFSNPYYKDVSNEYGLKSRIEISSTKVHTEYCYLCISETGGGWYPALWAKKKKGNFTFNNMGDSIVYLPVVYENENIIPIGNPFILINGKKHNLKPANIHSICIDRKYPLLPSHIKNWTELREAIFLGSNIIDFKNSDTLYHISKTPIFRNTAIIRNRKRYRYVRYVSPSTRRSPLAELEFWSKGKRVIGNYSGMQCENIDKCFDGNTFSTLKKPQKGYIIQVDLKKSLNLDSIVFYPKNDGNFIIPGNSYELFFYDRKWISLGVKQASDFSLTYDSVPRNSLLYLKNKSQGKEERIFTYDNNCQNWW